MICGSQIQRKRNGGNGGLNIYMKSLIISRVLMFNVGTETFGNLSDICQKSVRKLSVTKMCQKTVINVSEFCQKTVRCKYLSELYQKRFGNASEMCQIL